MPRTMFLTSLQVLEPAVAGMLSLCLELAGRRSAAYGCIVAGLVPVYSMPVHGAGYGTASFRRLRFPFFPFPF